MANILDANEVRRDEADSLAMHKESVPYSAEGRPIFRARARPWGVILWLRCGPQGSAPVSLCLHLDPPRSAKIFSSMNCAREFACWKCGGHDFGKGTLQISASDAWTCYNSPFFADANSLAPM